MKHIISLILAVVLVFSASSLAFAQSDDSHTKVFHDPVTVVDASDKELSDGYVRGTTPPSNTWDLDTSGAYGGTAIYSVAVYTNYKFSNHGGSIKISVDNSYDSGFYNPSTGYMTVYICHNDIWGQQVNDGSYSFPINASGEYTFTGLNTSRKYYFQFVNSSQTFTTETDFTVTKGN
ncbi:MAG: hypothetical protein IJM08_03610 [Firmicutes bacterium]|nr:hypothetical protein [Bacillota bacterium]